MEVKHDDLHAQAGQTWLMRNGKRKTIERIDPDNDPFPILVGNQSWMANGRYWAPDHDHSYDLIKQIFD